MEDPEDEELMDEDMLDPERTSVNDPGHAAGSTTMSTFR